MAKTCNANIPDHGLDVIKTGITGVGPANKEVACSAQPTTYTEANATYFLGGIAVSGADFTIAAGDGAGTSPRKITVGAKAGATVTNSGTATYVALIDTINSVLLLVTTCTSQALMAGNTLNFPAWKDEIGAPT